MHTHTHTHREGIVYAHTMYIFISTTMEGEKWPFEVKITQSAGHYSHSSTHTSKHRGIHDT